MPPRARRAAAASGPLSVAVADAIAALPPEPVTAGVRALAAAYAARLDDAARLEAATAELADLVDATDYDDLRRELTKLSVRADTVKILAELGPKLLAALVELGATRGKALPTPAKIPTPAPAGGVPSTGPGSVTPESVLEQMRQRRNGGAP